MRLTVGQQAIHVREHGAAGPPVLLLHSSGLSSLQWRRLADSLAADHRVLAPDFIGYGESAPWAGGRDTEWRDDLAVALAVASAAGAPVHVVGHSYGGLVALAAAASGAFPLASLSLYDPVAFGVLRSTGDAAGLADLDSAGRGSDLFAPGLEGTPSWCERFVDYWQGAGAWTRLGDPVRAAFLKSARKMFQEVRSLVRDATPHTAYAAIAAPTLLLTGTATPLAARRVVAVLADTIVGARVETIDGAGHMGPITHGEVVNGLIAQHVRA